MSFDLEKLQAVAELGEVIRLQNEALDKLTAFRKARPYLMMPNLAKMVEENIKENVQVLYKELNNLHKPSEQQVRYICNECKMAFLVRLPGGLCDECRARAAGSGQPRAYVPNQSPAEDEDIQVEAESLTDDSQQSGEKSLADQVADEVASDLAVAPPVHPEAGAEEEALTENSNEVSPEEENVYELSFDEGSDLSLENFRDDDEESTADPETR